MISTAIAQDIAGEGVRRGNPIFIYSCLKTTRIPILAQCYDYFAWVPQHRLCLTTDFMKAALEANGWTSDSKVRLLADGADGLSNLVDAATGKPTARVLDWFHISMRLRPIEHMSTKIAMAAGDSDAESKQLLTVKVPRIRYQL